MGLLPIILLVLGGAVLAGFAAPRRPTPTPAAAPEAEPEPLWTPDALARLGTPETAADLVADGRADELRGLGYAGDLPQD